MKIRLFAVLVVILATIIAEPSPPYVWGVLVCLLAARAVTLDLDDDLPPAPGAA